MFGKKAKPVEEIFIDRLPTSEKIKLEVKGAFKRQVENRYVDDEYGRTLEYQDRQLIAAATKMSFDSLPANKKSDIIIPSQGREQAGYAPAGSILRKIYPNEFTLHAFLAEAYWANVKSRKELWVERDRDSYALVAADSVPKKTIKKIDKILKDLHIKYYANKIADNLSIFGNCVLQNEYSRQGGLIKLNPLLMERISERYDQFSDKILGWNYVAGSKNYFIPYDDADHLATYNARSNVLGAPVVNSIIVDQEAALQGSIYNNNVMREGGLLSVVFRLRDPKNESIINDKISLSLADEFTKWLERRFGGIRGAAKIAFMPMIEGVDVLNKVSEMDSAWNKMDEGVARKTALLYGVPPERIGILTGSQYKNVTAVTDNIALSFDNNNYYIQNIVYEYLTKVIIQEALGIDNITLEPSGEFSSISKIAADAGLAISQMYADVLKVNEFRADFLHIDPLPGELGEKFLGEFLRKEKPDESNLSRAVGPAKHLIPEYRSYQVNKIRYKSKDIPYL